MIIVDISGGLGNQMFQYAAAYCYMRRHEEVLRLDISTYTNPRYPDHEGFLLHRVFDIKTPVANGWDYLKVLGVLAPLKRIKHRIKLETVIRSVLQERQIFHYDSRLSMKNAMRNVYLYGYWQVPAYFENLEDEIREMYTLRQDQLSSRAKTIEILLQNSDSVAVHIRRGDYVTNPHYSKIYGTCPIDYYERAFEYIGKKIKNPYFFIFSDDPNWVKKISLFSKHTILEGEPGESSWNDLYLMSQCKHNILANSSFSWWGAWLNKNLEKIVIAPQQWFADGTSTPDLLPKSWITL